MPIDTEDVKYYNYMQDIWNAAKQNTLRSLNMLFIYMMAIKKNIVGSYTSSQIF